MVQRDWRLTWGKAEDLIQAGTVVQADLYVPEWINFVMTLESPDQHCACPQDNSNTQGSVTLASHWSSYSTGKSNTHGHITVVTVFDQATMMDDDNISDFCLTNASKNCQHWSCIINYSFYYQPPIRLLKYDRLYMNRRLSNSEPCFE